MAALNQPGTVVPGNTAQQFASLPQLSEQAFYVSPAGSDANPGTIEQPFLTLEKARDTVVGATQPTTIYLRGGEYLLPGIFELTSAHSGTPTAPITYRNYPGETPHLRASKKLALPNGSAGTQVTLPLTPEGIASWELTAWYQLNSVWLENTRLDIARTPNRPAGVPNLAADDPWAGFFHLTDSSAPSDCTTGDGTPADDIRQDRIRYTAADFAGVNWALSPIEQTQVQVYSGFCNYQNSAYWQNLLVLDDVDTVNNDFVLGQGNVGSVTPANASYPVGPFDRYVLSNHLAFLDAPGEWFRDRTANTLTVNVPPGTPDGSSLYLNRHQYAVRVKEASYLTFQGIKVSGAAGNCIRLEDSTHITLRGNLVTGCDSTGILLLGDVEDTVVEDNRLEHIEGKGIHVEPGYGWNGTTWVLRTSPYMLELREQNNRIENNSLEFIGFEGSAVNGSIELGTGSVGNTATKNDIRTVSRIGVMSYGPLNTITFNRVTNANLLTSDSAGIYTNTIHTPGFQRSWLTRGNTITDNIVENGGGYAYDYATSEYRYGRISRGIFLDDYSSSNVVARNWLFGKHHECIFIHGGRDNQVTDNVCDTPNTPEQRFNNQTNTWTEVASAPIAIQEIGPYCPGGNCDVLYPELSNLAGLGFDASAFTTRFPDIATLIARGGEKVQGTGTELNVVQRNIFYYPTASGAWYLAGPSALNTTSNTLGPNLIWAGSSRTPTVRGRVGPGPSFGTYYNPPGLAWAPWQAMSNEATGVLADPLFANASAGDYRLQSGSPAIAMGIAQLDPTEVGLRSRAAGQPGVGVTDGAPGDAIPVTITDGATGAYAVVNREYRITGGNAAGIWQSVATELFSVLTDGLIPATYTLCARTTSDARVVSSQLPTAPGAEGCSSFTLANAPSVGSSPSSGAGTSSGGTSSSSNKSASKPSSSPAVTLATPPATLVQTGPLGSILPSAGFSAGIGTGLLILRARLLRRRKY